MKYMNLNVGREALTPQSGQEIEHKLASLDSRQAKICYPIWHHGWFGRGP